MPLTRDIKETIRARAQRDPDSRQEPDAHARAQAQPLPREF
jgi:hypothetical protein